MKTGFVSETWIAAYCHGCGEPAGGEEDGPALFISVDSAMECLTRFRWQTDGDRIICDACQLTAHCTEHGHDWTEWKSWTSPTRPYGPRHGRYRYCRHCDAFDQEYWS